MCGCRSGGGATAGTAGTAATAGVGGAGGFGPAATAGKASVTTSVAVMSRVKNPIFFKFSSSSDLRLGRSRCGLLLRTLPPCPNSPRHWHSIFGSHKVCRDAEGYWADALVRPCVDAAKTESLRSTAPQLRSQYRTSSGPSRAVPNAAQTNTPHWKSPLPRLPPLES